ncbi:MAG: M20 family metallopeptidase [Coriobacteriia bacterium]|nr:M20 family metallopeptidase [Coriobacteriia bacterium]
MNDAVRLARELVRIDTAGHGERVAAELLAGILARAGAEVELVPYAAGRAHLVARTGEVSAAPLVCSGHLDTVPVGDAAWERDALSGDVSGGMLHGRGAVDMKSGVAALVVALTRHIARGPGGRGIVVVLTAAEETGCEGARHLMGVRTIPGGGPLLVAEPTGNRIAPGHKGVLWLRVNARGRSAHGSRPDLGTNAIASLARLITALEAAGLPGEHEVMGPMTFNVGTIVGGTAINLVPDSASLTLDIRTVPGVECERILAHIGGLGGRDLSIEVLEELPPTYSPPDGPFACSVAAALRSATGLVARRPPLAYFTDAAVLAGALSSSEVVLLGPGDPDAAHTTDEACAISAIEDAVATYGELLSTWG